MLFNDWLGQRNRYTPDKVAITDHVGGDTLSYAELNARATAIAALLQHEFSVRVKDRVACLSTNRVEYLVLYFACGKIGAILVPLNVRLPTAGLLELFEDCRPSLLVHESASAEMAIAATDAGLVPRMLSLDSDEWQTDFKTGFKTHAANENDVAMLLYTSGTTGRAKAAMITWRQIHWNALNTIIGLQLTEEDVALLNMPLYHTGAWHVLFTPLMLLGGRIVLHARFDAKLCNEQVEKERVTILFGVPTMLRMMWEAANFATVDFSEVRFAICGGEPCPLAVIEAYRQRGVAIRQGYGLTEAGPNCFSLPAEDAKRKQGSIGFPNFFIDTRLVTEDGDDAEVEEVGELWMKGPHVCGGYWANAKETDNAFYDDWLRTGDLMKQDEDGYFFVVGRKKDMYISGGENVYPAQVERVLQCHAAIELAAVIGVPHPKWGDTGWAFCQLHEDRTATEAEVIDWCRQHLATFQCPTRVVMMARLPLGHSGKIDKLALQQRAIEDESIWMTETMNHLAGVEVARVRSNRLGTQVLSAGAGWRAGPVSARQSVVRDILGGDDAGSSRSASMPWLLISVASDSSDRSGLD